MTIAKVSNGGMKMTIFIGYTMDFEQKKYIVKDEYVTSILKMGAVPIAFPYTTEMMIIPKLLDQVNGLLLTGGKDINPYHYNEQPLPQLQTVTPQRDQFEILLINEALKRNLPILGICRGMHILNVAAGGTLYQDIASQIPHSLQHHQFAPRDIAMHRANIQSGSQLQQLLNATSPIQVNSFHHQAVKSLGEGFQISAIADDNVIEAIENPSHSFTVGVQWHPGTLLKNTSHANDLFRAFIKATEEK